MSFPDSTPHTASLSDYTCDDVICLKHRLAPLDVMAAYFLYEIPVSPDYPRYPAPHCVQSHFTRYIFVIVPFLQTTFTGPVGLTAANKSCRRRQGVKQGVIHESFCLGASYEMKTIFTMQYEVSVQGVLERCANEIVMSSS